MKRTLILVMTLLLSGFYLTGISSGNEGKPAYVGSEACKSCHLKEYKSWKNTKLASAIEVLKPGAAVEIKKKIGINPDKDYMADAKCLKCHTTGYGSKGGFKSQAETPQLAGVGCEMCHGPGEEYVPVMLKKGRTYGRGELIKAGLIIDLKAVCMNCHNPNAPIAGKDYKFSHKERFKRVHIPVQLKYHQKEERELE
ncbi:MAG: cytochrome c family protein [Thermodesulfovibrionales bacterium]|nr:cytochrome c family protein [Thermodesulfovibrionales bacterium]